MIKTWLTLETCVAVWKSEPATCKLQRSSFSLLPDFPYRRTVHSAVQIGFDERMMPLLIECRICIQDCKELCIFRTSILRGGHRFATSWMCCERPCRVHRVLSQEGCHGRYRITTPCVTTLIYYSRQRIVRVGQGEIVYFHGQLCFTLPDRE